MLTAKWMLEDVKKKLEPGEYLLVVQKRKGKSDLWKTFDVVVEIKNKLRY